MFNIKKKISLKLALWLLKHGYGHNALKTYGNYLVEDIHENGYYDVNTASVYNAEDHRLLNKYFTRIRYADNKIQFSRLIDNYYTHIYRRYNDHKIPHDVRFPEIVDLGVQQDRVVFDGLERQARLITGKTTRYMTHYAIGAGTNVTSSQVKPGENKVDDEVAREPMHDRGFADAKGSSIAFGIIFGINVPSATITNSVVSDGPVDSQSIIYLRTNYIGANRVTIAFGQTFGAFTSIIYQRSA